MRLSVDGSECLWTTPLPRQCREYRLRYSKWLFLDKLHLLITVVFNLSHFFVSLLYIYIRAAHTANDTEWNKNGFLIVILIQMPSTMSNVVYLTLIALFIYICAISKTVQWPLYISLVCVCTAHSTAYKINDMKFNPKYIVINQNRPSHWKRYPAPAAHIHIPIETGVWKTTKRHGIVRKFCDGIRLAHRIRFCAVRKEIATESTD